MANYQNGHSTLNKGLQLYKDFYFIDNNLFETFTIETFTFVTPDNYKCLKKKKSRMRKYVESKLTQQKQYEPKRPRFNFLRGLWTGTSNDRRMNGTSEWFINENYANSWPLVVQKLGSSIQPKNHYPLEKCSQNLLIYPVTNAIHNWGQAK
mgnify:CR=1 FL=1